MNPIKNTVALVTGANRGIGRAFVEELLRRDAGRIYAAARSPERLEEVVALDRDRILPLRMDVTDRASVEAAAAQVEDVGLLINNAGALAFGSFLASDPAMVARDMETNYMGTLHVIRAFAPALIARGDGAIVNVLSIVALANMPGIGGYSASKAAAFSLTQAIRAELSGQNVRVHGVFPGPVDTDMIRGLDLPKTSPADIARATLDGVEAGVTDILPDAMSKQAYATWLEDPRTLEAQFGAM
jgi:NAD(P)-dependent dehydrogenase (short-subunit alcohol dehydrogenase family)